MFQKRKRPAAEPTDSDDIYRSEPIEDRSSTFIGYFSSTLKPEELQKLAEISSASHKILAWRRESNQQAITGSKKYVTGHDDDGEKYGGKKIEKVLESMQVCGAGVVARWYGGVLLGPVRFTHIEDSAKAAIRKWQESESERKAKKRKKEVDAEEQPKLLSVLVQRDESIAVLRKLVAEKEDLVKKAKGGELDNQLEKQTKERPQTQPPEVKSMASSYDNMSFDRLRTLEKARDATLSFLLKRIEKAELELDSVTNQTQEAS